MNSRNITLGQFAATFIPFGLLLVLALMGAEIALDLPLQRMIYSVWVAQALVIPALCLYILPARTQGRTNYWLLFWTFAYIAYLFHFYYAVMVHYHASIPEVFQQQGIKIAGSNFVVTFLWGLDVLLAWFVRGDAKWIRIERLLANIFIPLVFFVASVVIFKGFVNVLGYAMTAAILICLIVRIHAWMTGQYASSGAEVHGG
jgi:hypothetical protein